ncbi:MULTISPECIES: deaminase [unclassified Pseudodesulfovibrio]|uniref:deaminase n=1 Tax=unclassified Pseudodesulfovibrio TaxID=2661612 RepID=UPI000FEBCF51|nr:MULTISPECIES: deaminase [unclassified Pseudodesulfovibrio]MCJ2166273.1 deaminase [Pseudodesulfovibrio sp. S3-i]RWU02258.1 hypothetical protein DWB63_17080 [Pseudodesulfovibrio sp. S3]
MSRDDFLIIGFTGAFASGCSESSELFRVKIAEEIRRLVDNKAGVNASITNCYNKIAQVRSEGKVKTKELRRDLKKKLRMRSLILAAQKTKADQFVYISMTVVMYSIALDWLVRKNKKKQIANRYAELCGIMSNWAKAAGFDKKVLGSIHRAVEKKHVQKWSVVQEYHAKVGELKDEVARCYKGRQLELFQIMQGVGNNLRKCGRPFDDAAGFENPEYLQALSQAACNFIKLNRKWQIQTNQITRTYYVIECFRNASEIDYFRSRFYEFYLFSLFCDERTRHLRAKDRYGLSASDCIEIDKRDQGSSNLGELYAQNITKCVNLADISLSNTETKVDLYDKLIKYFILIKNPSCITPTRQERNMHLAYSLSLSSTCISRKVGAVIVKDEYIVGAGWNDTEINRIGCGYRIVSDLDETNNRSFPLANESEYSKVRQIVYDSHPNKDDSFCYKDEYGKLRKRKVDVVNDCCAVALDGLNTGSLQQCRALHAEENAILQGARLGGVGVKGATLFTTTFPCELCAKKIMQVGISAIIYCEPYPKSVSLDVFLKEGVDLVKTKHFEGVKSPSYYKLFKASYDAKDRQQLSAMWSS